MQDHYVILGISVTATGEEIKQAYKKAALRTHPDKNNNSQSANEEFKKVNAAYECLSDPIKRKGYDRIRKPSTSNPFTSSSRPSNTTNPSQGTSYSSYDPRNYSTPRDILEEEVRLSQKWRSHNLQKVGMEARKKTYHDMKEKIADLKRQMDRVQEEMKKREEERKFKTTRTWLGSMVWGEVVLPKEEVNWYEEVERESLMKLNSLRIKISKEETEFKRMESYPSQWEEWKRQDGIRQREEDNLKVKKERRKAADQAEAKRKAEEEQRERERKTREEAEKARKARAEAQARARAESLRKAQEERRKREEEAERLRKEQEEAERLRKEREEAERVRRWQMEAEKLRKKHEEAKRYREMQEAEKLRKAEEEHEKIYQKHVEGRERAREQAREQARREAQDKVNPQEDVENIVQEREEYIKGTKRQRQQKPRGNSGPPRSRQARLSRPPRTQNPSSSRPQVICTHQNYWRKIDISSEDYQGMC
ncbi:uncharacterized protein DFL_001966 [Arthrobotrys flagrans]|uniref:J domain-containing protein n=1 Tax=Arthrobotrys flagrans TaxID=97331 RepID=A0A437A952_ARTFL|nr:hypothetical protein DFL_001966 [Arthrobotrys flagrans]